MKRYALENIRNISLLSHCGAGKTSLAEAILYTAGATSRLGRVDNGTTTSDYDPDEIKRKISLNLTMIPADWQDTKINLIDTPGYADFMGEVKAAIRVSEAAIIVVCAASGVEVGTEQVWGYSEEANLARLIFVNKMDRENADFSQTVAQIQAEFGSKCAPIQIPIGAQNDFQGMVDLVTLKSYIGAQAKEEEIPASLATEVNSFREKLIESIAETSDELIEKYLSGEELSVEELTSGLRKAIVSRQIVPILAGSATQNIGTRILLNTIHNYLPSPKEQDVIILNEKGELKVKPSPEGPLAALVFKTSADPYVGKLTYFRVYSGTIESNSQVWNTTRGGQERLGQLFILRGKNQEPAAHVSTGDIGGVAKLSVTCTGDTLGTRDKPLRIAPTRFPEPAFSEAVYPKTKADIDKLGTALSRMVEEDPTLRIHRETDTNETILSGLGETQLEVAADKMQRKFGVNVELKIPKVPYKETITSPAKAEYKHKKQTGGHGQFGHVLLELEPLSRGSGHEFIDRIVGGAIPKNYIPAVEKGVNEAIGQGTLAGYPVVDIKTTLYDGSFHPVDSSDICFKIAGAGALKKGLTEGQPILLEPIMNLQVRVPEDFTGDIIGDLNAKRARVLGMNPQDGMNVIEAQVPQSEILRYAIDLKSITQGRGSFSTEFSHYEETPAQISQRIITERQAEKKS